ncbi:MAG: hypothetical protein HY800_00710 [Ignavibacteriales bacterium]|nr:hypothetical protein [Ignavibacteriales bacterium]
MLELSSSISFEHLFLRSSMLQGFVQRLLLIFAAFSALLFAAAAVSPAAFVDLAAAVDHPSSDLVSGLSFDLVFVFVAVAAAVVGFTISFLLVKCIA